MKLLINGNDREFDSLLPGTSLLELLSELGFKSDRIAIEHNGAIVPRDRWAETVLSEQDKLEIVHFVGGGLL